MHRRGFLGRLLPASFVGLGLERIAAAGQGSAVLVRGTQDGHLFRSIDGGKTWQLAVRLGEGKPVLEAGRAGDVFQAVVGCHGGSFVLQSGDGWRWRAQQG